MRPGQVGSTYAGERDTGRRLYWLPAFGLVALVLWQLATTAMEIVDDRRALGPSGGRHRREASGAGEAASVARAADRPRAARRQREARDDELVLDAGASAYNAARYEQSATAFDRLQFLNVVEPWRAHFGSGTALHRTGDLDGAEAAFREALELAPLRCDIRFNLVVTIEAQGDRLAGAASGLGRPIQQEGLVRYAVALDIANGRLCPPSTAGDAGVRLDDTRRRLRAKLDLESSAPDEELSAPVQRDEPRRVNAEGDARLEQIAERNQEGAADREDVSDLDPTQAQEEETSNW